MLPRLRRAYLPAKRLGLVGFAFDASASCLLLIVQFRAIEFGAGAFQLGLLGTLTSLTGMLAAIQATDRPGRLAGTMEAVLSAGLVVGPYLGGVVSQTWSLRASLPLAGAVYQLAFIAQVALWVRHHAPQRPPDGPVPP